MPLNFWLGRICEEFHCLPAAAYREWRDAPDGLLEQVIESRAYAAAYRAVKHAKTRAEVPDTPLAQLAQRIEFDLAHQEIDGAAED